MNHKISSPGIQGKLLIALSSFKVQSIIEKKNPLTNPLKCYSLQRSPGESQNKLLRMYICSSNRASSIIWEQSACRRMLLQSFNLNQALVSMEKKFQQLQKAKQGCCFQLKAFHIMGANYSPTIKTIWGASTHAPPSLSTRKTRITGVTRELLQVLSGFFRDKMGGMCVGRYYPFLRPMKCGCVT